MALASDFKNVEEITPVGYLKAVLDFFKPQLHIVNVNSEIHVALNEELKEERAGWLNNSLNIIRSFILLPLLILKKRLNNSSRIKILIS